MKASVSHTPTYHALLLLGSTIYLKLKSDNKIIVVVFTLVIIHKTYIRVHWQIDK